MFAILSNMANESDIPAANKDDERATTELSGGLYASRSDVNALQMGFMNAELEEDMVGEGD